MYKKNFILYLIQRFIAYTGRNTLSFDIISFQICLLLFIFLYVSSYVTVKHFKSADSDDISAAGTVLVSYSM